MEKKETTWIPDDPDMKKHKGDQTDQQKPEDSSTQEGDQTDQQKPEDSKKEVTEAEWLATGRLGIEFKNDRQDKNRGRGQ
ncbi:hypothetical protein [Scytonema sp. PRP1]|uniref:hypothetical protein n=1 Tax=Scytonema sp. PRP1 TaxID=3120513 RepID=UPI002FD2A959